MRNMNVPRGNTSAMHTRDIVVIGASAGGVEALVKLVACLPGNLQAAVFVVLHLPPGGAGLLAPILGRNTSLPTSFAENGEPIRKGHIYVAPPDRHLLLQESKIVLSAGPTHNRHRPGIDPLFESAAKHLGSRVIGVVLTGFLDDGTEGIVAIQNEGGYTIIQDPEDALVPSMPRHALQRIKPDACLPLGQIGPHIGQICREPVTEMVIPKSESGKSFPTTITCPECHGVINEIQMESGTRYECQVGHSFTIHGLLNAQGDELERALWAAVRSLEEGAELSSRLAKRSKTAERQHAARLYQENASRRSQHAKILRDLLEQWERYDREAEVIEDSQ